MEKLIEKANRAILEAQWLRREGRTLRAEAAVRASELGETVVKSRLTQVIFRASLDQPLLKP